VAARQSSGRRQKKPPLTATRYKQMVRELAHLYDKYQGDMDEIISFMGLQIASAVDRAKRMTKSPGAGAPELWNKDQLAHLWVKVRARQIAWPGLTVRAICRELVSAKSSANPDQLDFEVEVWPEVTGYEVWANEKRSISREEVSRYVTNAEQLRRRFGDADKAIRDTATPTTLRRHHAEVRWLCDIPLAKHQKSRL
jgi:hypothetical protein